MIVGVQEAKTHLSRLLKRAASGEEITIANAGVPIARLVPIAVPRGKRELGIDRGKIWIPEDFDAPSRQVETLFAGRTKAPRKKRQVKAQRALSRTPREAARRGIDESSSALAKAQIRAARSIRKSKSRC
jgi:prevent-host-death family protein